ncbi:hypothetical protein, partial [Mycobacterium tuberculosis]
GDPAFETAVNLQSATPGVAWTASASKPWVHLVETSGVTPAALHLRLDASSLPADLAQATVTIATSGGSCTLPVNLDVDAL